MFSESNPTTGCLARLQHLSQRLRISKPVIVTDLDQRRDGQAAVLDEFNAVLEGHNVVLFGMQDGRVGFDGRCRSPFLPGWAK